MTIKAFIHLQLCNKITVLIILFKKVLHYALLSKSHISLDQFEQYMDRHETALLFFFQINNTELHKLFIN